MKRSAFSLALVTLLSWTHPSFAEETTEDERDPLWEWGIGVGGTIGPAYPASGETTALALPVPYLIYRGDVFRLGDGDVAKVVAIDNERFELDLSFNGSLPADSEDVPLREGMPDLDTLFEIGPQLIVHLNETDVEGWGEGDLDFRLKARAVLSTDFSEVDHQGFIVEPTLSFEQEGVLGEDSTISLELSADFGSEALMDYFYEVDPQFARAGRSAFDAEAGYLGSQISLGAAMDVTEQVRGFLGGSLNLHHGATNDDSPLFEENVTARLSAGFIIRLYESDTKASWSD